MTHPVSTTVDRRQISRLVSAFYADVRADALLSPVFARFMRRDWPEHLVLMTDFWCTALKLERSFRGDVYGRHMVLTGVTRGHLLRWLHLWQEHASRSLPQAEAERVQRVALGMARVLHLGWFDTLPSRDTLRAELKAAAPGLPARGNCVYARDPSCQDAARATQRTGLRAA